MEQITNQGELDRLYEYLTFTHEWLRLDSIIATVKDSDGDWGEDCYFIEFDLNPDKNYWGTTSQHIISKDWVDYWYENKDNGHGTMEDKNDTA
jgi:hypothetical protein